jgi:hypothetical protein
MNNENFKIIFEKNNEMKWPNLFIVGAPKAGTHSLYEYLNTHPDIFMANRKEPYFFCPNIIPKNDISKPIRDEEKYLELFNEVKNEKYFGEATASYLRDPEAALLIYEKNPKAKILISLRNPTHRAFSQYTGFLRGEFLSGSFRENIHSHLKDLEQKKYNRNILHGGFYYEQVKKFLDVFPKEQVMIISFESFIENPQNTINDILEFLGLEKKIKFKPILYGGYQSKLKKSRERFSKNKCIIKLGRILIKSQKNRHYLFMKLVRPKVMKPKINDEDKILLKTIYFQDVEKLEKLLKKKFHWF